MEFAAQLHRAFGDRARANAPLAPLTTFHVGGPADWLVEAGTSDDLLAAIRIAAAHGVALTVVGGGSNVLVGDRGIRGLVVHVKGGAITEEHDSRVRADAGVTINGLVRWTISRGLSNIEAWAGTPGTVGGGIHGNAHFQGRLLGDLVHECRLAACDGDVRDVPAADMAFGYDTSRLQRTGEILLSAAFHVGRAAPTALRETARASLHYRKQTQPLHMPSAGCVFQNPDPTRDELPAGVPPSAGALVDRAELKGTAWGGARVSSLHGNFVVNEGTATARDIRALIDHCKERVRQRFGITLREEIVYLGEF
jgi:UDP-N-acetylmuramate dehydrogenase